MRARFGAGRAPKEYKDVDAHSSPLQARRMKFWARGHKLKYLVSLLIQAVLLLVDFEFHTERHCAMNFAKTKEELSSQNS